MRQTKRFGLVTGGEEYQMLCKAERHLKQLRKQRRKAKSKQGKRH